MGTNHTTSATTMITGQSNLIKLRDATNTLLFVTLMIYTAVNLFTGAMVKNHAC